MYLLTPEEETKIQWPYRCLWNLYAQVFSEDGKVDLNYQYICFGKFYTYNFRRAKYIDFYVGDVLTPILKKCSKKCSKTIIEEWVSIVQEAGFLRSVVEIEYIKGRRATNASPYYGKTKLVENGITSLVRLRFDVTKTSLREMFFAVSAVRQIQEWPAHVYNFFKLHEMMPDKPLWEKFYISALCPASNVPINLCYDHTVIGSNTLYLKKSPEEYLNLIDEQGWLPLNRNNQYQYQSIEPVISQRLNHPDYLGVQPYPYQLDDRVKTPINEEIYNSFLSEEAYLDYKGKHKVKPKVPTWSF